MRVSLKRIVLICSLSIAFATPVRGYADPSTSAAWEATHAAAYPNGVVYFLIGNLEEETAELEFKRYFSVARWLSNKGYQPMLVTNARLVDIREAVSNPRTTGVIFSSHANANGQVRDFEKVLLPPEIFEENAGERFKFVVISACNGDSCVNNYKFQPGTNKTYWEGTTDSDDLFKFLNGTEFNERLFKKTVGGVKAKQCQFQFLPPSNPG